MNFKSSGGSGKLEHEARKNAPKEIMRFGISFLDDANRGIFQDDVVLIGAPSGVGKTQLCCNIANANLQDGKRIHYIALEAGEFEIERRLKFPLVLERFLADPDRPRLGRSVTYASWLAGDFLDALEKYELDATAYFQEAYRDLFLLYKQEKFGVEELVDSVLTCSDETDLIIIDHVHYFDFDDDNENRAIKSIAKTVRTLALQEKRPIVLVAHLRKRDKANEDLVAGQEEFHGSSDLFKIATKVVTFSPGRSTADGLFETFFRIPKNRNDGSPSRFIGREFFNPKKGEYEKGKYQLGWAEQKRSAGFAEIDPAQYPEWARLRGGMLSAGDERARVSSPQQTRAPSLQRMPYCDQGDAE